MNAIAVFFGINTVTFTSGPAFRIGASRVRWRVPISVVYTFTAILIEWMHQFSIACYTYVSGLDQHLEHSHKEFVNWYILAEQKALKLDCTRNLP